MRGFLETLRSFSLQISIALALVVASFWDHLLFLFYFIPLVSIGTGLLTAVIASKTFTSLWLKFPVPLLIAPAITVLVCSFINMVFYQIVGNHPPMPFLSYVFDQYSFNIPYGTLSILVTAFVTWKLHQQDKQKAAAH
ncbi:hypothetical protein [Indiicoccus explosivorum]|uniref:hypothetical protein n=1 Tax=Indiicoccus explosivorum TaxID=1917864 RepID=UPI000B4496D6|nr:hypothetical protein [Indiicoccus explosivorum]